MSNLPSSPPHKPLQVAPPGSLQDTKQLGERGEGRERGLGTAMANLESSLSHGELHPSAPDAGECVGRGPPRPPTLNALCTQLAFRKSLQFLCGGGWSHRTLWHFRALCELPPPASPAPSCQRVVPPRLRQNLRLGCRGKGCCPRGGGGVAAGAWRWIGVSSETAHHPGGP